MSIESKIRELAEHQAPRTIDPAGVVDLYRVRRRSRVRLVGLGTAALLLAGAVTGGVMALRPASPATSDVLPLPLITSYSPNAPLGPGCPPGDISLMNGSSTGRLPVVHVRRGQTISLDLKQEDWSGSDSRLFDINIVVGSPGWYPGTASFPDSGVVTPMSPNVLGVVTTKTFTPHVEIPGIDVTGRFPIVAMYHFTVTSPTRCQTGLGGAVERIGSVVVR